MNDLGGALLVRARNAIAAQHGLPQLPDPAHPDLLTKGATFVTLTKDGQLRGCIGTLDAHRKLDDDVRHNAVAAAFHDSRFKSLQSAEWPQLSVEVSLLTAATPITFASEADALRQLRPGIDGVVFVCCNQRSTFLPQVWESLPQPREFLAQLKRKAGLSGDYWGPDVKLYRYEVQKWKEKH
jgi:hypothetical protein